MCFAFTMCAAVNPAWSQWLCVIGIVRFTDCVRAGFA